MVITRTKRTARKATRHNPEAVVPPPDAPTADIANYVGDLPIDPAYYKREVDYLYHTLTANDVRDSARRLATELKKRGRSVCYALHGCVSLYAAHPRVYVSVAQVYGFDEAFADTILLLEPEPYRRGQIFAALMGYDDTVVNALGTDVPAILLRAASLARRMKTTATACITGLRLYDTNLDRVAAALFASNGFNATVMNGTRGLMNSNYGPSVVVAYLHNFMHVGSDTLAEVLTSDDGMDFSREDATEILTALGVPLPTGWVPITRVHTDRVEQTNDPHIIPDNLAVKPSRPEYARARKYQREHPEVERIEQLPPPIFNQLRMKGPIKGLPKELPERLAYEIGGGTISFAVGVWNQLRNLQTMWKDRKNYAFVCSYDDEPPSSEHTLHPYVPGKFTMAWVRFGLKDAKTIWVDEVQSDLVDFPELKHFQTLAMKTVFRAFIAWAFDEGYNEIQMPNSKSMVDAYLDGRKYIQFYDKAENFGFVPAELEGFRNAKMPGYRLNPRKRAKHSKHRR